MASKVTTAPQFQALESEGSTRMYRTRMYSMSFHCMCNGKLNGILLAALLKEVRSMTVKAVPAAYLLHSRGPHVQQ